jgi:hypothetical protein
MQGNVMNLFRAGLAVLLVSGTAYGGFLPTDPAAMSAWQNSKVISAPSKISATVEYAVYAPGQFANSAALGFPTDPSGGTDYVYAYEVYATSPAVKDLTVQTTAGAVPPSSTNIGDWMAADGGLSATGVFNLSADLSRVANAKWTRSTGILNTHSDVLYFTSAFAPHLATASISGGGSLVATGQLPSPIPEPTAAALAAITAVCLLGAMRVRRRYT